MTTDTTNPAGVAHEILETWRDWQREVEAARANAVEAIRQFNGMRRRAVDAEAHLDAARERLALVEADAEALADVLDGARDQNTKGWWRSRDAVLAAHEALKSK